MAFISGPVADFETPIRGGGRREPAWGVRVASTVSGTETASPTEAFLLEDCEVGMAVDSAVAQFVSGACMHESHGVSERQTNQCRGWGVAREPAATCHVGGPGALGAHCQRYHLHRRPLWACMESCKSERIEQQKRTSWETCRAGCSERRGD